MREGLVLRRYSALLLALVIALALPASALAQAYSYGLDKEVVHAFWNEDGTLAIDYTFTFTNQPGAHVIDFVDVAMPNNTFSFDGISADVDGRPMQISTDFQGSGSGVAVALGADAIQPGQSGTVHVFVQQVQNVLYPDSSNDQYASAVFAPARFTNAVGSTDLTVVFHLPPGVQPEEPRWHAAPSEFPSEPQTSLDETGRVTYTWAAPNASASTQYNFGASFPKSYVAASAIAQSYVPEPASAQSYIPEPASAQSHVPVGATTTPSSFDIGGAISSMTPIFFICGVILIFFCPPVLGVVQEQRRKLQYLPPRISIEGHGIKRGLTAVEAAIVMEEPLDKVMTMILFAAIKKNAARVLKHDPLRLEVASRLPGELRNYEAAFLKAFREDDLEERQALLQEVFVNLVRSTSERMRGFSRKETVAYYKSIIEEAWQQVEAAETPEVKSQLFDENLDWTMLGPDFDGRTRRVFTGPVFLPTWWGHYDPTFSRPPAPTGTLSAPSGTSPGQLPSVPSPLPSAPGQLPSVPLPHLPGSDFAASVASGVQTFAQRVIGDISTFTSGITDVTNPPPPPAPRSTSGWGGTGGFSGRSGSGCACACACACAGCACACAGGSR